MKSSIPIIMTAEEGYQSQARIDAKNLGLAFVENPVIRDDMYFILHRNHSGLMLCNPIKPKMRGVHVDFTSQAMLHRLQLSKAKKEDLIKAMGIRLPIPETFYVVDATAGFGLDSMIIAAHGCRVVMLERHPIVAALLSDGLARALLHPKISSIASRVTLHHMDSKLWLSHVSEKLDVVYLDPMFPVRKKSSLVKKEMQFLHALLEKEDDTEALLEMACNKALRVVMKRPVHAEMIGSKAPSFTRAGRTCRFDVWI